MTLLDYNLPIGVYRPVQPPIQPPLPAPGISVASLPVVKKQDEVIKAGISKTDFLSPVGMIIIGGLLMLFMFRRK